MLYWVSFKEPKEAPAQLQRQGRGHVMQKTSFPDRTVWLRTIIHETENVGEKNPIN